MDYKGNYFPDDDEQQESTVMPPSKTAKTIKKIFKIALYSISAFVYVILFWRIFSSCDPGFFKTPIFSQKTIDAGDVSIYYVQTQENMGYYGRVQLGGNAYADETDELELGIKINLDGTEYGDKDRLVFVLSDSHGTEYEISAFNDTVNDNYYYVRVCFEDVKLDLDANYYIKMQRMFEEGETFDDDVDSWPEGLIYRLYIYEKGDDGEMTLLDDLIDHEYLQGKKDYEENGLKIYSGVTVVTYDD